MEEKKYEIIGKVEIGTDEYRDLIRAAIENEKQADDYRHKFWTEESKTKELQEKVEKLEKSIAHYREFVNSDDEVKISYRMYLKSKEVDEC